MKKAPIPANDQERLEALSAYDILDTSNEEIFDEITQAAAALCDCPISLVSLVDKDRQWFKSRYGLEAEETPRDISYCGHAIVSDELFIVEDAKLDERFCDNPLLLDSPHVRFYAGAPLVNAEGFRLGTLCVIDSEPKSLTKTQKIVLKSLSRQVVAYLEMKKENHQLSELQQSLEVSEYRTKVIIDNMLEGMVVQEASGEISEFNTAALKILCLTENQLKGRDSLDPRWASVKEDGSPFPGEEHPAMVCLRSQKPVLNTVMGICSPEGDRRWIKINSNPVWIRGEQQALTTFSDITNERRQHQQSEELNTYLQLALEGAGLGIWDWYLGDNSVKFDARWAEMLGLDVNEISMELSTWESRVHPEDLPSCYEDIKKYMDGKSSHYENVHRMKHVDGHWVYILDRGRFSDWNERGEPIRFTGTHLDITDRVNAEKELEKQKLVAHQQSRLASIGQLAAGVGHEINNPLAIAKGYLYNLKQQLNKEVDLTVIGEKLLKIDKALDRIANIVRGLRTFSRADAAKPLPFDAVECLSESIGLMSELFRGSGIQLKYTDSLPKNTFFVLGQGGRLQQIVTNLLANAKDAVLSESTRLVEVKAQVLDGNLKIEFSDSGPGIPEGHRDKIFEPFFTTKEIGKGTGIGLSIVYNYVKELGGEIRLKDVDRGTCFDLEFPVKSQNEVSGLGKASPLESEQEKLVKFDGLQVLVADDEPEMREVLGEMLAVEGVNVTLAKDGSQALSCYLNAPEKFDLILSDVKMPTLPGPEFFKEVRSRHQGSIVPFLVLMTGGVDLGEDLSRKSWLQVADKVLDKPFSRNVLVALLSEVESLKTARASKAS